MVARMAHQLHRRWEPRCKFQKLVIWLLFTQLLPGAKLGDERLDAAKEAGYRQVNIFPDRGSITAGCLAGYFGV